jgi:F0F1-type ATP synthase membrane subunit a
MMFVLFIMQAIVAANPNTVVVLINGGQVAIEWIKDNVDGIIEAFYPGEMGGDAIVDVLVCVWVFVCVYVYPSNWAPLNPMRTEFESTSHTMLDGRLQPRRQAALHLFVP